MPSPGKMTPRDQVKQSSPGSRYSAAYEYNSPTEADKREMQNEQAGQELQPSYIKNMTAEINKVEFEKGMEQYLNPPKGRGRKTRKTRKSRRRKSRRTRKH